MEYCYSLNSYRVKISFLQGLFRYEKCSLDIFWNSFSFGERDC